MVRWAFKSIIQMQRNKNLLPILLTAIICSCWKMLNQSDPFRYLNLFLFSQLCSRSAHVGGRIVDWHGLLKWGIISFPSKFEIQLISYACLWRKMISFWNNILVCDTANSEIHSWHNNYGMLARNTWVNFQTACQILIYNLNQNWNVNNFC
jgi:hypothetical protein